MASHSLHLLRALTVLACTVLAARVTSAATFQRGDVFAAATGGRVGHYDATGQLIETLQSSHTSQLTGCGFDADERLYVTTFAANAISIFDPAGNAVGDFGSGYDADPESILFDGSGHALVGQADGTADVLKFNSSGKLVDQFDVAQEARGSDWIDLAADQCTLFYTSEGKCVKRYDVCQKKQLADLTCALPNGNAFALRLLPGGGLIVADREAIHRLDTSGAVVKTYDVPDQDFWFAANLDPDGKSFWSGNLANGNFYKFDIASGDVLIGPIDACDGTDCLSGLCVLGEVTAAAESNCSDGKDNDGDREVDCQDEDCQSDPVCESELHCTDAAPTILGTNGDDVLRGTSGNDVIFGRKGNDRLLGMGGNDIICGGMGRDTVTGGKGRDELHGGSGRDLVRGGPGSDALNGGPGTDRCLDDVAGTTFSPECEN